jgi:hypothetical protein
MKTTYEVRTHKLSPYAALSQAHTLYTMANRNPWLGDYRHRHGSDHDEFGRSYSDAFRSVGHIVTGLSHGYILSAREVTETEQGKRKSLDHFRTVGFARAWPGVSYDHSMGIDLWNRGTVLSYWLDEQFDDRINEDPRAIAANAALHQSVGAVLLGQAGRHVRPGSLGESVACFVNPESTHSPLGLTEQMKPGNYGVVHVQGADYSFDRDNASNARIYEVVVPGPDSA